MLITQITVVLVFKFLDFNMNDISTIQEMISKGKSLLVLSVADKCPSCKKLHQNLDVIKQEADKYNIEIIELDVLNKDNHEFFKTYPFEVIPHCSVFSNKIYNGGFYPTTESIISSLPLMSQAIQARKASLNV